MKTKTNLAALLTAIMTLGHTTQAWAANAAANPQAVSFMRGTQSLYTAFIGPGGWAEKLAVLLICGCGAGIYFSRGNNFIQALSVAVLAVTFVVFSEDIIAFISGRPQGALF